MNRAMTKLLTHADDYNSHFYLEIVSELAGELHLTELFKL